jgi:hypothetical protein
VWRAGGLANPARQGKSLKKKKNKLFTAEEKLFLCQK